MWLSFAARASSASRGLLRSTSRSALFSPRSISRFLGFTRSPPPSCNRTIFDLKSTITRSRSCSWSLFRGVSGAAVDIASTDFDEDAEVGPEWKITESSAEKAAKKKAALTSMRKFHILRRKQMKLETETWEQAVKEYRELLDDMCKKKLAPNLPYVKSLFLSWFEPLRDKIAEEQENCKDVHCRTPYAPCINLISADMMAVITMHKMMSMMMTGDGSGSILVVSAACQVGEAIEHELNVLRDFGVAVKVAVFLPKLFINTASEDIQELEEDANTYT
ncbi:hypothetical protein KSP40_PGU013763 [Platanthera guangdongensis]|uniref:DNA-directed RNA polymerase N-terminal domain-containing protein n=1 Tax=Platanthera guangdongensis TaxID=2320717 RepID=A0ABR2LTI8_9ASPA